MKKTFIRTAAVVLATSFLCMAVAKNSKAQDFPRRYLPQIDQSISTSYTFCQAQDTVPDSYGQKKWNGANIYQIGFEKNTTPKIRGITNVRVGVRGVRNENRTSSDMGTKNGIRKTTHSGHVDGRMTFNSGMMMGAGVMFGENQTYAFKILVGREFGNLFGAPYQAMEILATAVLAGNGYPTENTVGIKVRFCTTSNNGIVSYTGLVVGISPYSFDPKVSSGLLNGASGGVLNGGFDIKIQMTQHFGMTMEGQIGEHGSCKASGGIIFFF